MSGRTWAQSAPAQAPGLVAVRGSSSPPPSLLLRVKGLLVQRAEPPPGKSSTPALQEPCVVLLGNQRADVRPCQGRRVKFLGITSWDMNAEVERVASAASASAPANL